MGDFPQNSSVRVGVTLAAPTTGTPVTGVVYTAVTATAYKADGSTVPITMSSGNWAELTSGAFANTGTYDLVIPGTVTNVLGLVKYAVSVSGAVVYRDSFNVITPFFAFTGGGTTTNPTITKVTTPYSSQMIITFSTGMKMDSSSSGALNISNYFCPGLTLSNPVSLAANVVMLTTSSQVPGLQYTVSVSNVQDLNGNVV